ncbi:MAG: epoxyqueuosine reductase [Eggerthellaceae bacterium]|nr:epoxyqueuosine reductase [Eggerthellaceae bacterium]
MADSNVLMRVTGEMDKFVNGSSGNYISLRAALSPSSAYLRLYDEPIYAVGSADDPLFPDLKAADAVGPQMFLPTDWLEDAKTVLSYFLPFSERMRESNRGDGAASEEWLHGRIEGQMFVMRVGEHAVRLLRSEGYDAVCPALQPEMQATFRNDDPVVAYRSTWSERHVAYVCGLGTFSLSRGIITEKGMAGRLGSVVTNAPLPVTQRAYHDLEEYCIKCGACVDRCPAGAISLEGGKDHYACHDELEASKARYPGYYGCGKCQVGVPCECGIPHQAAS